MTKGEILEAAARDTLVEKVILAVTHRRALPQDYQDLAQIVYVALLEKPAQVIEDIHSKGELRQYIAGIVNRQVYSPRSTWNTLLYRYADKQDPLDQAMNVPEEP